MADDFDAFIAFILGLIGGAVIVSILTEASKSKRYSCPNCGTTLVRNTTPCPKCKTPVRWL